MNKHTAVLVFHLEKGDQVTGALLIRLCCKNLRGMLWARNLAFLLSLDNHSKQAGDECHLFHAVSFFDTTDLPFPEHVDRFISL